MVLNKVYPKAEGLCYKTTFGDWKRSLMDIRHRKLLDGYFPAPSDRQVRYLRVHSTSFLWKIVS